MKTFKLFILCFTLISSFVWHSGTSLAQQQAQEILLPREELVVETNAGKFTFSVEIADEDIERSTGLMFRTEMAPNHGMLFDFGKSEPIAMWMQNTVLSLDMIFIQADGIVLRVARNTTPFSRDIITSGGPVSHVLEVNAGIANQIGLKAGDRIIHPDFNSND
ncbi:MAG: DUF192 domain-containing protein [Rhizobiaceae bacterium]|nr:DUF192 domain-containing protein [Rhizobiaceae bacterium]